MTTDEPILESCVAMTPKAEPVRALFVSHDSSLYGAQLSLLGLLSSIDRERFTCTVVTANDGPLVAEMERVGIPVFVRPLTRWVISANGVKADRIKSSFDAIRSLPERVRAIKALIDSTQAQLVYTNTVTCVDGAIAAKLRGRPHVWHLREHIRGNRDLESLLPQAIASRLVSRLSRRVIVNSSALRAAYLSGVPAEKIDVVHNGIDISKFAPDPSARAEFRSELGLMANAPIVGLVGSITPRKGHLIFVDAAASALREHPQAVFVCIGHGEREFVRQVRARIVDVGIGHAFHILDWRSDIARLLQAFDLLVIASDQEAFGRTVIEAMACGLPVVATRSGGPEEIVVNGETGHLVPVNDPAAMGSAISAILRDPRNAAGLGQAGRRRAVDIFSVSAYAGRVQSILSRLDLGRDSLEQME